MTAWMHDGNKTQRLCEALEITGLEELHPNSAELLQQRILTLDAEKLSMLLGLISTAKQRFAARQTG